jgi:predicted permease
MTAIAEIARITLPVFLVIAIGYFLRVVRFLPAEANRHLSRLVFYVAAPALLFRGIARESLSEVLRLDAVGMIVGITVLLVAIVYSCGARLSPARRGVVTQGAHRSNMVFVGLPIVMNAYGTEALGAAAVLIGFMVVTYNLLAVTVLILPHTEQGAGKRRVIGRTMLEILRNPLIIASAAGLVFSGIDWELPITLDRSLELVGRIAMPLSLIAVGVGLDLRRLRSELGTTVLVSSIKLVVYPALIYLGLHVLGYGGTQLSVPVLIMASPTAVVSYIMAQEMKGDGELAGSIVIGTTLFSLFTISGWLAFIQLVSA